MEFATLLHRYRKATGLTQEKLAGKAGVSVAAIGALERGVRRFPRSETVNALAYAMGLTADERKAFAESARRQTVPAIRPSAESAAPPVPRQLPLPDPSFTGRTADLATLQTALTSGTGVAIIAITGMGGAGKTTIAVKAAHAVAAEYPDGQAYLDLHGYGPDPLSPLEALNYLLRAFGLSGADVPVQVDEAAARLRSQLAGRRALILLDNARDAAQVEALLPGTGRSAVLITSRHELAGMPTAQVLRLGLLSAAEGLDLLRATVGATRVDRELEAAQEIVEACGLLPLALKISAGRLATRLQWPLTHLAGLLRDERRRLDQLEDQELGVRASFDVSIDDLAAGGSDREQRAAAAFALFGVPDGPDLTVEVAARLLDCDEHVATDALEDLCNLHLVESLAPRRYRLHDLLRVYARERAQASIGPAEQAAAVNRVLDLYASAAWQSTELGFPRSGRLPWYRAQPPIVNGGPKYDDMGSALSWLDGQRHHLLALTSQAVRMGGVPAMAILRLVIGLHPFYATRGHWLDCLRIERTALEVAAEDPRGEAHVRSDLGLVLYDLARAGAGHPDDSIAELHRSRELFESVDDLVGEALALANLSHVLDLNGDYQQAIDAGEQSLTIYRKLDDGPGQAIAYINIGNSQGKLRRTQAQRSAYDEAIAISTRYDAQHHLGIALLGSGVAYQLAGDFEMSLDHLHQATTKFEALSDQLSLAEALDELGLTYRLSGNLESSITHLDKALTISTHYDDGQRHYLILTHLADSLEASGDHTTAAERRTQATDITKGRG
ncbi:tetratricopeptide repeat protein [Streptomyces sp. SID13031]|uniref:tetratricopeptide repeat protein n=1 Tax=Streptomyces sp. SID13031 TaxID=2706046 RepID=UPI0013CAA5AD|nr:tetratricopeptide repeat protein [Streptomyces sp. SID13031]NEA31960.1 tetratricopeptide repeat protein [Streptomyces sp. SID13031]